MTHSPNSSKTADVITRATRSSDESRALLDEADTLLTRRSILLRQRDSLVQQILLTGRRVTEAAAKIVLLRR